MAAKATGKQLDYLYSLQRKLASGTAEQRALEETIRKARNKVRGLDTGDASDWIDRAKKALA